MYQQTTTASTSTADLPLNSTSARGDTAQQIPRYEQDLDANRHQPIAEAGADEAVDGVGEEALAVEEGAHLDAELP